MRHGGQIGGHIFVNIDRKAWKYQEMPNIHEALRKALIFIKRYIFMAQ